MKFVFILKIENHAQHVSYQINFEQDICHLVISNCRWDSEAEEEKRMLVQLAAERQNMLEADTLQPSAQI
jgi:hypothetical protein